MKLIVIGLLIATLLSLISNLVANKIEPFFAGQPYVLLAVFLLLLSSTICCALFQRRRSDDDGNEAPVERIEHTIKPVSDMREQKPVPNYHLEKDDVIVNYKLTFLKPTAGRYIPPPHIVGKGGRLFGRADVFVSSKETLLSQNLEPVVLHGLAGVGKSAVASALAWGLAPYYDGGVLWLGRDVNNLSALCNEIGRLYADDNIFSLNLADKFRRIRYLLNQQATLVVLDGCENRDVVQVFAEQCAPQGLIVTTREKMALIGKLVDISPLTIMSSIELFRSITHLDNKYDDMIEPLVSLFDGHPQAITIAGALCVEEHLTPTELRKLLEQADQRVHRLQLGDESNNSVWASFEVSYNKLGSKEQQVFQTLGGAWSRTVTPDLITHVVGLLDKTEGDKILRNLAKYALLTYEEDPHRMRIYHFHDLTYCYCQGLLHEQGQKLDEVRSDWISGSVRYAKIHVQSGSASHDALEIELENILGAAEWAKRHQRWEDANALALLLWNSGMMELRGYAVQGLKLLKGGLFASRKLNSLDDEGVHLTNLAAASFMTGDYHLGEEYAKQALDVVRVVDDYAREETNLEYLGQFQWKFGNIEQSLRFHEQALAIARKIEDKQRENACLGFIAVCCFFEGKFRIAIGLYEQALCIARKIRDRTNEGRHLSRMGDCYVELGEFNTAIKLYQQALDIAQEINNRIGEQFDLGGLGRAYRGLGQYDLAIDFSEQALQIARSTGFPEGQAYLLAESASLFAGLGQAGKGMQLARESLDIALRIDHARCEIEARRALAECAYVSNDKEQAMKEAKCALEVATATKNYEGCANILRLLGKWALDQDNYVEARRYLEKELIHREEMEQRQEIIQVQALLAKLSSLDSST